jgi:hypothetical protein
MIWIKNKILPFKGYKAITIWPFVFYRGSAPSEKTINHEAIHGKQQLELLLIPFYLIYALEGIRKGYRNISFEKEAYDNDDDLTYLKHRKWFGMWRK